jgi:hypothetical protein
MTMKHRTLSPRILLTLALVLPMLKIGCVGRVSTNRKCFAWTKAEGACPAQTEAIDFFSGDGSCPPPVQSVESEGEFLGDRCCYEVTDSDANPGCMPSGAGGAGGPGVSTAFAAGVGGSGCVRCSTHATQVFQGLPFVPPCWESPESEPLWNTLFDCLCTGPCQSACSASVCSGVNSSTTQCFDCAADTSVGCGDELTACTNDL